MLFGRRAYCNLTREERLQFSHASWLLPTNDEVSAFNQINLESLGWFETSGKPFYLYN